MAAFFRKEAVVEAQERPLFREKPGQGRDDGRETHDGEAVGDHGPPTGVADMKSIHVSSKVSR